MSITNDRYWVGYWREQAAGFQAELREAEARAERTESQLAVVLDLLREHTMDWGHCTNIENCDCSHARAYRYLRTINATPTDGT